MGSGKLGIFSNSHLLAVFFGVLKWGKGISRWIITVYQRGTAQRSLLTLAIVLLVRLQASSIPDLVEHFEAWGVPGRKFLAGR